MHNDTGQYASFWRRAAALLLDLPVMFAGTSAMLLAVGAMAERSLPDDQLYGPRSLSQYLVNMTMLFVPWLYYTIFEHSPLMATPGKYLCRMRVTTLDGRRLSLIRSGLRTLGKLLSEAMCWLGFLMPLVSPRRQALHDYLAGTVVLTARPAKGDGQREGQE